MVMSAPPTASVFRLELNLDERAELLKLLDQALRDLHVEKRRTEAMDYRDQLARQENILRGLADKARQAQP
jgi:hypothetical protein